MSATELGPLVLAGAVALPYLLGDALLRALGIGFRTDRLAQPGWAWMCGSLATAVLELVLLLAGWPGRVPLAVATLILAAALHWRARRVSPVPPDACRPAGRVEHAFFALAVAVCLAVGLLRILASTAEVLVDDDEANFWALRAKLLFLSGGLSGPYADAVAGRELANASYPPLDPLLQLTVFQWAGEITHFASRLPIQLCALALLASAAAAFRHASRPAIAAVLLLLLASVGQMEIAFRRANADVLVALGALVAGDALRRHAVSAARGWGALGAVAAAFLVFSKKEGGVLLLACAAVFLVAAAVRGGAAEARLRMRGILAWGWPALAAQTITWSHNLALGASGSHTVTFAHVRRAWDGLADAAPRVLGELGRLAVHPGLHAVPAVFFALALLTGRRRPSGPLSALPLGCALFLASVVGIYVTNDADYLLRTTSGRVLLQLVPVQLLWIGVVLGAALSTRALPAPPRSPDR